MTEIDPACLMMDDFDEIFAASKPFEEKLTAFLEDYLKQYPTYEQLCDRFDLGEVFCIDYKTLDIKVMMQEDLPLTDSERELGDRWSCSNFYYSDVLPHTKDNGLGRHVNAQDIRDIAYHVMWRHKNATSQEQTPSNFF